MAIGEREIGASVVIGAGEITPRIVVETIHEKAIINGIRLLIEENESAGGIQELGLFEELDIQRIKAVRQLTRISDHGIH